MSPRARSGIQAATTPQPQDNALTHASSSEPVTGIKSTVREDVQLITYGELPAINILLYGDLVMFGDNPEKRSRWLKLGRKQFVLRFGVLGWGVPTAILFSLTRAYEEGWNELPMLLVISLIMFPLAGILWGRGMWRWLERRATATVVK